MLKPIDIENQEFKRTKFGGYSIDEVDTFLDEVIYDYERLFRENSLLREKIKDLDEVINYYKSMEDTIKNSLIKAEKNAEESKKLADTKAEQIIKSAEERAEQVLHETRLEASELRTEVMGLKAKYVGLKEGLRAVFETQIKMLDVQGEDFDAIDDTYEADDVSENVSDTKNEDTIEQ